MANTAKSSVAVNTNAANVPEGTMWVTQADLDAFNATITAAETVKNNAAATQTEVDATTTALTTATSAFNNAKQNGTNSPGESISPITSVADLTAYLETLPFGSAENPSVVPLSVNISAGIWESINTAVEYNGKYVILDLSACIATDNTIVGKSRPSNNDFNIIKDNAYITGVTLPSTLTSIGDYAFYECSGLSSVTIPGSVTSIGQEAFSGCSGLTNVTIPDSVTSIGQSAFYGCTNLTSVIFRAGSNITTQWYSAFPGNNLWSVYTAGTKAGTYTRDDDT